MAHYGMLRDYEFAEDVDDIRGSNLYASDGDKIGEIKDVIFDHESGNIEYLVTDVGDHKALIASSHIFRAATDEDDFTTDLTRAEAAALPRFNEKTLEAEHEWNRHHEEHRRAWKEREDRYEAEFKRKWDDGPVVHRKDSTNIITDPGPVAGASVGEREISAADLTPRRIADKFSGTAPMVANTTNQSTHDVTMRPAGTAANAERDAFGTWTPSERLDRFRGTMRERLPELRKGCGACPGGTRRVA